MARYRTIQTDFWSDPYIEELSAYRKLLYIYLFTSPHTQNSGVLNVTVRKISYETGASAQEAEAALEQFESEGKIVRDGAAIWVVNFIKNQTNTSPKIIAGLKDDMKAVTSRKIRAAIAQRYPYLIAPGDTVSAGAQAGAKAADMAHIGHKYPMDMAYIPPLELEKELEKEKEGEKEGEVTATRTSGQLQKSPECPCAEIAELYNTLLPALLPVQKLTDARKKTIRARWREDRERQDMSWWRSYFEAVGASDYLMGRDRRPGNNWQPDFDWLTRPTNMMKVLEGKYANRRSAAQGLTYEEAMKNYSDPFGLHTEEIAALRGQIYEAEGEEL